MKDLIVCSHITHRQHFVDEYEDQLAAAGIDFHLEPITLTDGIASITARWKFSYLLRMAARFADYERIVFTDGWDVLFIGTREELLPKLPSVTMISAERNCWPEPELAGEIISDSPWCYANAGMITGSPSHLVGWAEKASQSADLDLMEQTWFNRHLASKDPLVRLDWGTSLFYTVSCDKEDGALQLKDGKVWNSHYDTYPQLLHFAGPCSSVPFRRLLRGACEAL